MTKNKVFPLRMPADLREAIDHRAEKRLRSLNNEILILLKLGLVNESEESKALNTAVIKSAGGPSSYTSKSAPFAAAQPPV